MNDDNEAMALAAVLDCQKIVHHRQGERTHSRLHIHPAVHEKMAAYHKKSAEALECRVSAIALTLIHETLNNRISRFRGTQT